MYLPSWTHSVLSMRVSVFLWTIRSDCWKFWLLSMNNTMEQASKSLCQVGNFLHPNFPQTSTPEKAKQHYLLLVYIAKSNCIPCSLVKLANVPKYYWQNILAVVWVKEFLTGVWVSLLVFLNWSNRTYRGCNYELLADHFQLLSQNGSQRDTKQRLF